MPVMLEEKKERQDREIELRNVRLEVVTSRRQRRQMLVALAILLIAIVLLMVKDWQVISSWFSSRACPLYLLLLRLTSTNIQTNAIKCITSHLTNYYQLL